MTLEGSLMEPSRGSQMERAGDVFSAIRLLAAEAELGAPVSDGQIAVAAAAGDTLGVWAGLRINATWRRALAAGDDVALAGALAAAVAFAERPMTQASTTRR